MLDPELRRTGKPRVDLVPVGESLGSRPYHSGPVPRAVLGGRGEWTPSILLHGDEDSGTGEEPVFAGVVPGDYLVELELDGYRATKRATVRHDETTVVRFGVERSPIELQQLGVERDADSR